MAMFFMSSMVRRCFARCTAYKRFGMAMAAMMPMMATTTSNSIRVKPFLLICPRGTRCT